MRCRACNINLSDYESTRKYMDGTYVDLCNTCWRCSAMYTDLPVFERDDLEFSPSEEEELKKRDEY